jgi:hypothetical protein
MIVKLKTYQFDYLNKNLSDKQDVIELNWKIKKRNDFVFVEIESEDADKIRDWAIDEQSLLGFDSNYELTEEGTILQELIDVFFQSK